VKNKKLVIHLKSTREKLQKNIPENSMTTAAARIKRSIKRDGLGSENVVSIKLKSMGTLPLAIVESRFPPICSKFTLGSVLYHPNKS